MSEYKIKRDLFFNELRRMGFENTFEEVQLDNAVGFRAIQDMKNGRCVIGIVIDDSIFSTITITFASLDNVVKREKMLDLLNELNQSYKTTKFYINDENQISAQMSYISLSENFNAEVFMASVLNMYRDIEENEYAKVMRVMWS